MSNIKDSASTIYTVGVIVVLMILFWIFLIDNQPILKPFVRVYNKTRFDQHNLMPMVRVYNKTPDDTIHIVFALTRDNNDKYVNATVLLIKSIVLLSNAKILFHIFTNDASIVSSFEGYTSHWHSVHRQRFTFLQHELNCAHWEPKVINYTLFQDFPPKLCMLLELPNLRLNRMIFLDADTVVISDIQELWQHFNVFETDNFISMAIGGMKFGKLKERDKSPRFGRYGLNSGVILIDLDKYKSNNMIEKVIQDFNEYSNALGDYRGDQAFLNSILARHRNFFTPMPCSWNFLITHFGCKRKKLKRFAWRKCDKAWTEGAHLLHDTHQEGYIFQIPVLKLIRSILTNFSMEKDPRNSANSAVTVYQTSRYCHGRNEIPLISHFLLALSRNRNMTLRVEHVE